MPALVAGIDLLRALAGSARRPRVDMGCQAISLADSVRPLALQLLDPSLKIGEALLYPIHVVVQAPISPGETLRSAMSLTAALTIRTSVISSSSRRAWLAPCRFTAARSVWIVRRLGSTASSAMTPAT
jgi:hypothetical protein